MGFHIENDLFAKHAWYFRNALVRANYQNIQKGITANREYLERFLRNLLMGEQNELRNRYLLVNALRNYLTRQVTRQATRQVTRQVTTVIGTYPMRTSIG